MLTVDGGGGALYVGLAGRDAEGDGSERTLRPTPQHLARLIIRVSCGLLFLEYLFVPISYVLGGARQLNHARVIQSVFLVGSMGAQWALYKKVEAFWNGQDEAHSDKLAFRELLEPLQEISGVPVAGLNCFGVSEVTYLLLSLSPNFINVLASAVFVGTSAREWAKNPDAQKGFASMWAHVPIVGWQVGHIALPMWLAFLLVWTCLVHVCFVIFWAVRTWCKPPDRFCEYRLTDLCDSANMLFVGKVLARREKVVAAAGAENHGARFFVTFSTKVLLLWGKISLLTVISDQLTSSEAAAAWQAIVLGFYSVFPLLIDYVKMINRYRGEGATKPLLMNCLTLPFVYVAVVVLPSHVAGIVLCPSHDFSLLMLRCTLREGW